MDRGAIDKICALQAEIDGYRRFILDENEELKEKLAQKLEEKM